MILSCLTWQDMGFLSHSDEQRKAVFNPTWALFSKQIYFVDGAVHISLEKPLAVGTI